MLNYLGIISVGGISVATGGRPETVDAMEPAAKALGKKMAGAVIHGFSDPAQEAILADNRACFQSIVTENRDIRPEGYERWVRMGWIP
jgi:hypothetical protein